MKRLLGAAGLMGAGWLAAAMLLAAWLGLAGVTPAQAAGGLLKVGVLEEPKSLNPWLATDTWSSRVVRLIYDPLYIRDPKTLDLVPWLAESLPKLDFEQHTYTVRLRKAKWSDGTPFTAEDVAFTAQLILDFKIPLYYDIWDNVTKIEVLDPQTVRFTLKDPQATFVSRTMLTPIVQKAQWTAIAAEAQKAEKPLVKLRGAKLDKPIGTGPFKLEQWQHGVLLQLVANPHFFGKGQTISGHTLGPHISSLVLKVIGTADAAILALRKGDIDMYWNGVQSGFLPELEQTKDIQLFHGKKSALYFLGFNLRRPPMSDAAFRRAVAVLVDRDFIVKRILQGAGEPMMTIIPQGNAFYHNPDVNTHGGGLDHEQRLKAAYEVLKKAGYTWQTPPVDAQGKVGQGQGLRMPDGKPVGDLAVLTPPADYDPNRAMAGMIIQEWLKELGVPAASRPMAFSAMLQQVKAKHDFDLFVLGYGHLNLDPDYLRSFFHSSQDKHGGWNMSGYRDKDFDAVADRSEAEMDPARRRKLIFDMQKMVMEDVPYLPLYNPALVEAVRTDKFTGWVEMVDGIGNLWSFCNVKAK